MSNISKNNQFIIEGEIESSFGFYKFFFANLRFYQNIEQCFEYCNIYFREKFGYYRYENYAKFRSCVVGSSAKKTKLIPFEPLPIFSNLDILEREFLMAWFQHNGFDSWESFKAIVIYYYSEVTEKKLREFYSNTTIDSEVLLKVGYVKQIIGG